MNCNYLFSLLAIAITLSTSAQSIEPLVVDKVVGVVGKSIIQYSDIEDQYLQMLAQGSKPTENDKCQIFEDFLVQKLMVTQAGVDSIEVSEPEVEIELEQRISYFVSQIGTEEKLIEYFGKSIIEIKSDMRDAVRDQLLMQRMRAEIVKDISVTPSEVRQFYYSLPKDSIPLIESEMVVNQIVLYPKSSDQAIFEVKERLLKLRERIINGENFATMAILYSEDPAAPRGGDIGWGSRAELDAEYVKAAFALKVGQVSKIVESSFGYHLIKLEEKTEDRVRTRHIILKPKIDIAERKNAQNKLDSIVKLIRLDSASFETAAMYTSEDKDTRMNGGLRINPYTGTTKFQVDQFDTKEYYVIRNMKIGEISDAFESVDDKGKTVYKVIRLKDRSEPHRANLKQDFNLLKQMAMQNKQTDVVDEWVKLKMKTTYIKIAEPYNLCNWRIEGWTEK